MTDAPTRVLIVDDEAPARRRIAFLLRAIPGIEIIGQCSDGIEAVAAIREEAPDLVFLDVQMPAMTGFDVIREIGDEWPPHTVIVFVTAYDEFAVQAFEVNAVDYLVKPFTPERFEKAVERARAMLAHRDPDLVQRLRRLLGEVRADTRYATRLLVKDGGRQIIVPTPDIAWIEAADNYLRLHVGAKAYLLRETMASVEARLDPAMFIRIHRSTLVNLRQIEELGPLFNKDHIVRLRNGAQLVVSRTYYDRLIEALTRR